MHVLIAPDSFTGTLTATQAAEAMAQGWREAAPEDLLTLMPLSDGGPGFLDVLAGSVLDTSTVVVTVADPLGREVPAAVLLTGAAGRRTAYVEAAQAVGLHLLAADERNPAVTSTWGVGQLLEAALAEGAERIVVGLGGSATNDGGAGMLARLGAGSAEDLGRGGLALARLGEDALPGLASVRARFAGTELLVASASDAPLLGFHGASAVHAPRKGASPELAQQLESALGRLTEVVHRTVPPRTDLMTGQPRRVEREPGAGAGGGLGYALMLLGARRVSGVEEVLGAVGFPGMVAAADLVVTGEGCFDWQSLRGSVIAGVAGTGLESATPTLVVAGQVSVGRRDAMALGLSGMYAVAETPAEVEAAVADPVGTLAARVARIATTWSPRR